MQKRKIKDYKKLKTMLFPADDPTRPFWKQFEVNIDKYCDKWELFSEDLVKKCECLNPTDLTTILHKYKIKGKGIPIEQLLVNTKIAVDFYCVIKFVEKAPKVLSNHFGIPIQKNLINRRQVILRVFEERMKFLISPLFLLMLSQNRGTAKYRFKVHDPKGSFTFQVLESHVNNLVRYLNRKSDREYEFRSVEKINGDYYALLVKETSDRMICALPKNIRVQSGQYVLIRWHDSDSLFSIDTKDWHESNRIKSYFARKTKLAFAYARVQGTYNPEEFLASLLAPVNDVKDLILLKMSIRSMTTGEHELTITNTKKKNNIVDSIKQQIESKGINLLNFSNYKSITFLYREINYTVQFRLDKYSHTKLHLVDQKKPIAEVAAFKAAFNKKYSIPFNAFLRNEDETEDLIQITRKIVRDKTISAEMPQEYEGIVLKLISNRFIYQPTENGRRRCVKCNNIFWQPGDCRDCGTETYFEGDYLDIIINEDAFEKYVYKAASKINGIKVERVHRQIQKSRFDFIELIKSDSTSLSVYISNGLVHEKITNYFMENGLPLLIILLKYKEGLEQSIRNKNFECLDFAEIVNANQAGCTTMIEKALTDQHNKWQQRVIDKGFRSYERLSNKPKGYNDQSFERDIFNLLHEMFLVADRMGERLTGTKAPDGITCIQSYTKPLKRFCLAWDCKYSELAKGYSLREKPDKHRYYLNKLTKNETVRFYGGLAVYAFITQNMNMVTYLNFYKKMTEGFKWNCQVLLLFESQILNIYKTYKSNEALIQSHPEIYYARMIPLFTKIPVKEREPYKRISNERIIKLFETLVTDFNKKAKIFKFQRADFV